MDFEFSPEQLDFLAEVEAFLDANDDPEVFDVTRENMAQIVDTPKRRAFMAKLGEVGWLGITWPKEYGGTEGDGVYEYLLNEALAYRGGPQIGKVLEKLGKKSEFIQGMRVTDRETMDVVEMVLGGLVNKEIVSMIDQNGGKAVGLTGKDGGLIRARKMMLESQDKKSADKIDIGYVGEVQGIDPRIVSMLENSSVIPVIAPIGMGDDGETYNINADVVAGKLAITLKEVA